MTFLIPSYLQKRLLRYALSRLDLIDTDALDLEKLDISWGQTSTIELRDLNLKRQKLFETLRLPKSFNITQACLRSLRITVPANIYTTGISVEVLGIDVQLQIQETKTQDERGSDRGISTSASIQRPGVSLPSESFPDLLSGLSSSEDGFESSPPVPSSRDLATSFLQTEPREDRLELEAALSLKSNLGHGPADKTQESDNDIGIGPDGGISLPTFLTGFFQGIADRLRVSVRDVSISAVFSSIEDSEDREPSEEPVPFLEAVLKVGEVAVEDVRPQSGGLSTTGGKRRVNLSHLSIELVHEFDERSSTSSKKSRDRTQSTRHKRTPVDLDSITDTAVPKQTRSTLSTSSMSTKSSNGTTRFPSSDHLSAQSEGEDSGSMSGTEGASNPLPSASHQSHARISPSSTPEDLAESKLFTHEEAESMYLSAVSDTRSRKSVSPNMPGAWSEPDTSTNYRSPDNEAGSRAIPTDDSPGKSAQDSQDSTQPLQDPHSYYTSASLLSKPDQGRTPPSTRLAQPLVSPTSKKVLWSDSISLWLPTNGTPEHHDTFATGTVPATGSHPGEIVDDYGVPVTQPLRNDTAVEIAALSAQVDLYSCRALVRAAELLKAAAHPDPFPQVPKSNTPSSESPLTVKVKQVTLGFYENVPTSLAPRSAASSLIGSDEALFQLQVENLDGSSRPSSDGNLHEMRLSRVQLLSGAHRLLSFDQTASLRESIKDLSNSGDDIRISVKSTTSGMNLDIHTLPLQLFLDLPTIDDFLTRSGGLSSLLDVGSSLSTISAGAPPRSNRTETARPRSVRFQTEVQSEPFHGAETQSGKTNIRLQGLTLTISGSEAALKFQTSAVKIVHRSEGLGLQVDKANLLGPYFNDWRQRPAVKVSLENTRLEYLESPREADLDRLLAILSPSKGKFDEDDDIMLDTLLRQRRKGPVLRTTFDNLKVSVDRLDDLDCLPTLGSEVSRLSTVAKYLPEDDRPGLLFLLLLKNVAVSCYCGSHIGTVSLSSKALEIAHVSLPALAALKIPLVNVYWRERDLLLGESIPLDALQDSARLPMLMCKFIADAMEPTIKIKLFNIRCEYSVSLIMAILGINGAVTGEDVAAQLASSITNLDREYPFRKKHKGLASPLSSSDHTDQWAERLKVFVTLRDCTVGLNPRGVPSKGLLLFSDAKVNSTLHRVQNPQASLTVSRASIMLVDSVENLSKDTQFNGLPGASEDNSHQSYFVKLGFVPVGFVSSAAITMKSTQVRGKERVVEVEIRDDLLILETAADSTQTLIGLFGGLQPPMPVSKVARYRTEVLPIEDMLASLSGDAFVSEPGPEAGLRASADSMSQEEEQVNEDEIEYVSEFYPPVNVDEDDDLSYSKDELFDDDADHFDEDSVKSTETCPPVTGSSNASGSPLGFQADHFQNKSKIGGTVHRWDTQPTDHGSPEDLSLQDCPLRIHIRDVHVIWNLFDGYDWQNTRDQITRTVQDVEQRAYMKRDRVKDVSSPTANEEEDTFIGDCLFNSVYIGIPANRDPKELTRDINRNIDDLISETGSHATTSTITQSSPRQASRSGPRAKRLRLTRSKHHKMTFEFSGINADFLVYPNMGNEAQSSLDLRIQDLVVFDHVPTSTWRKFATYMLDAGERERDTSMLHVKLLNVKPVADLAATEIVLKVSILPLRLHVDQDALDFMSRFFEFKDGSAPSSTDTLPPFFQRVEVNPVKIKLDFKPKRVDYGGLRSGRTTEFMNFFVLDSADMVLRRVILYGVSGFDRLGQTLNDIWMPDVKRNQLPGILAGLAPVRSLVNVGGGVKDLVVIPMREYQKDGRIVRSVQKGAVSFAKTTTKELVKLGAKLALGTQTVLQNAETALGPGTSEAWEEEELVEEAGKRISLYADQPLGVVQGLRGAYASLERDLVLAKDAIVAVPGEIIESGSAGGAARAVLKQAPTIVLRPAIGMSKAIGQTLLGAGNSLDKQNLRRAEEKYKLQ